jgi:3-oxoacyl-[acyl-carrier protein] reductase
MTPEKLPGEERNTLTPRVIIISGGSRGLGEAFVRRFFELGDIVATFSRKRTATIDELQTLDQERLFYREVDATDSNAMRAFVTAVHEKYNRIDALVNNAGLAHDGVLATMSDDRIDQMLDINLRASLLLARECSRIMLLAGAGSIINISSIIAKRGFSGLSAYAATKAGQIGMTLGLARELGPKNIRVNAIAPGYLETEMSHGLNDHQRNQITRRTPLGRLGKPADIVPCVEFLLSPGAAFITGQVITIDGGSTV